jgi:hypothetical protein|uniref:Uncharacterized protein n=1 Tax=Mus musculus TaxID=10090 RepID=Q3UHM4_MOUSE|nr:unnamed protein product [Mus musculus]
MYENVSGAFSKRTTTVPFQIRFSVGMKTSLNEKQHVANVYILALTHSVQLPGCMAIGRNLMPIMEKMALWSFFRVLICHLATWNDAVGKGTFRDPLQVGTSTGFENLWVGGREQEKMLTGKN